MVSEQLASRKRRKLALHHGASALKFHQTLQELESLAFDLEFNESLKGSKVWPCPAVFKT
jgi:hypothetical protein